LGLFHIFNKLHVTLPICGNENCFQCEINTTSSGKFDTDTNCSSRFRYMQLVFSRLSAANVPAIGCLTLQLGFFSCRLMPTHRVRVRTD
jgi:hypothetical protein